MGLSSTKTFLIVPYCFGIRKRHPFSIKNRPTYHFSFSREHSFSWLESLVSISAPFDSPLNYNPNWRVEQNMWSWDPGFITAFPKLNTWMKSFVIRGLWPEFSSYGTWRALYSESVRKSKSSFLIRDVTLTELIVLHQVMEVDIVHCISWMHQLLNLVKRFRCMGR